MSGVHLPSKQKIKEKDKRNLKDNENMTIEIQERIGLMAYLISFRQMGHWVRARAQDEQVTMWAHGRNTMSISASMHTLHM